MGYVTEQLRRFRPLVALGHDLNGEYGHGAHMLYADLLTQAVEAAADESQFPESARRYGVWDTPKTYLHLYEENPIVMDWDRPLSRFDGMSAYQVTKQLGFPCHNSQKEQYYWYFNWNLSMEDHATDIRRYSPCNYGLYRSTVGEDVEKNDFFENLMTYDQQAQAEAEAKAAEEARLAEEARQAEEEAARQAEEEARRASEAAESQAAAETAAEHLRQTPGPALWIAILAAALLLTAGAAWMLLHKQK